MILDGLSYFESEKGRREAMVPNHVFELNCLLTVITDFLSERRDCNRKVFEIKTRQSVGIERMYE